MAQIFKSFYALIIFLSLIFVVTGKGKRICILFFYVIHNLSLPIDQIDLLLFYFADIKCIVAGDCPNFFVCPPNNFVRCIKKFCKCRLVCLNTFLIILFKVFIDKVFYVLGK